MTNEELIKNMAMNRDNAKLAKEQQNWKLEHDFYIEATKYSALVKELINVGNMLLDNGFEKEEDDFQADYFTHNFGFRHNNGRVVAVGQSLGDNDKYYRIFYDGNDFDVGPKTFRYDDDFENRPAKWFAGMEQFCKALTDKFGVSFENIGENKTSRSDEKKLQWTRYIKYLIDWAGEHKEASHYGMSPACFDEWCDNEDGE